MSEVLRDTSTTVKEVGGLGLEVGGLLLLGKSLVEALVAFPGLQTGFFAQAALGLGALFVGDRLVHSSR